MKKVMYNLGMVAILGLGVLVNAQTKEKGAVGINTQEPQATLDVRTFDADGTTNEGIIAPKLTKERVAKIAIPVEGTLVYVTDATYTGNKTEIAKIDDKGYYYFDGTEWVKAKGAEVQGVGATNGLTKTGDNIELGGALTKATNIALDGNNLTISGNGNVGIGTSNPAQKLEVRGGGIRINYASESGSGPFLELKNPQKSETGTAGRWRLYNMTGRYTNSLQFYAYSADGRNLGSRMMLTDAGNVGIGVQSPASPTAKLDVNGNARIRTIADGNPDTDYVVLADTEGYIKRASVTSFKGPKGDTGAAGAQGPAGAVGPKGDKGEQGDSGVAKGINGITYNEKDKSVALGGDLTEITTINQNNNNLIFTTGATGQFKIDGTSNITGAQYVNIRIVTDNYFTLQANDYMINYKGEGGTVTLPKATDSTGRVVCFYNYGGDALATKAKGNAGNIQPGYGGCIISDGIEWITKNAY